MPCVPATPPTTLPEIKLWCVVHEHRHGVDAHFATAATPPDPATVIAQGGSSYEPDLGEGGHVVRVNPAKLRSVLGVDLLHEHLRRAHAALGTVVNALDDASPHIDPGEDEQYAYQAELSLGRTILQELLAVMAAQDRLWASSQTNAATAQGTDAGQGVTTPFRIRVRRRSRDEDTRALICGRIDATAPRCHGEPDPNEVLKRLQAACTEWREACDAGREAWDASCEDFNIGDLSNHLGDTDLMAGLAAHGLTHVTVTLQTAQEESESDDWHYDTVLMDPA